MSNTRSEIMLEASDAAYELTFVDFDGIGGYKLIMTVMVVSEFLLK